MSYKNYSTSWNSTPWHLWAF